MQKHDKVWIDYFSKSGYPNVEPLASGMEGAVYKLGDDLIGKVWARRQLSELIRLKDFYSDFSSASLSFATPHIHEVTTINNVAITIEQELHGIPLQNFLSENDVNPLPKAVTSIIKVLRGLHSVKGTLHMKQLTVLDEAQAFWSNSPNWSTALIALMGRRVEKFGDQLRSSVNNFDIKYSHIVEKLATQNHSEITAIHGDLCGVNILVDEDCNPTAVLDFGFLSSAGDPAFDIAITAAIFNMYGPHAQSIANKLTTQFSQEFGYSIDLLLFYRAVYAIISSNAYDPNGQDGHFAWCAAILNQMT